jgi:hypothetical protein
MGDLEVMRFPLANSKIYIYTCIYTCVYIRLPVIIPWSVWTADESSQYLQDSRWQIATVFQSFLSCFVPSYIFIHLFMNVSKCVYIYMYIYIYNI